MPPPNIYIRMYIMSKLGSTGTVVKIMGSRVLQLRHKFWLYHLLVIWPWASYITSLCLSFFIYDVGIIIAHNSLDYCEI